MLIEINAENPNPRKVKQVVECINDGGVVIYPTDTVYTIGCDLYNKKAMKRIAQIKGKVDNNAHFSLICRDLKHISEYALPFSNTVFKMMRSVLPGPYTFILNANKKVPKIFDFNKSTIGIRVPDNNIARILVEEIGHPIIATSVHNSSNNGIEYLADPYLIHEQYGKLVDIVIDGGIGGQDVSTIIDATESVPYLIRQGIGEVEFAA